jgi:hypothetical protein
VVVGVHAGAWQACRMEALWGSGLVGLWGCSMVEQEPGRPWDRGLAEQWTGGLHSGDLEGLQGRGLQSGDLVVLWCWGLVEQLSGRPVEWRPDGPVGWEPAWHSPSGAAAQWACIAGAQRVFRTWPSRLEILLAHGVDAWWG